MSEIPAKIISQEDFLKVLNFYKQTTPSNSKNELRNKLESYINKHLIKLNEKALKNKAKLADLLSFLIILDDQIPSEDFFAKATLDVFPTIFKLTFYGEDHSVTNFESMTLDSIRITDHPDLQIMIEKTKKLEGKCNLVVNNLLAKMLYHCDK